jgi:uncharacterized protein (UPF0276 family)
VSFATRIRDVPRLGVGVSCEFDAGGRPALDPLALREAAPELVHFLEIGADVERGLDGAMRAWAAAGLPITYHFLDVNLAEEEDVDGRWIERTVAQAREVGAAWLCGDAGFWHLGRRERGHGLLLPPVLRLDAAMEMARAIRRLKNRSGMLVLPENPAAAAFVGRLHLLDFFARVVDGCDTGFLLDVSHLAIFQRMRGHRPTDGLDGFPLERIVEVHVAGGSVREHRGLPWVEDDHSPEPLADAWEILETVVHRARNLKAIVYECEHSPLPEVLPGFERLNQLFPGEAP